MRAEVEKLIKAGEADLGKLQGDQVAERAYLGNAVCALKTAEDNLTWLEQHRAKGAKAEPAKAGTPSEKK